MEKKGGRSRLAEPRRPSALGSGPARPPVVGQWPAGLCAFGATRRPGGKKGESRILAGNQRRLFLDS